MLVDVRGRRVDEKRVAVVKSAVNDCAGDTVGCFLRNKLPNVAKRSNVIIRRPANAVDVFVK